MDKFVQTPGQHRHRPPNNGAPGLVMDYYDGNTVTALWNYAQHYALNDNSSAPPSGRRPRRDQPDLRRHRRRDALNAAGQADADRDAIRSADARRPAPSSATPTRLRWLLQPATRPPR